jgi:hypothetical protein
LEKFSKILYLIKNYIHNYCTDELERYNNELTNTLDKKEQKDIKLKIKLLENVLNREVQLSMTNLVSFLLINDKESLDFATKSDNKNYI